MAATHPSGRDYFDGLYQGHVEDEAEWLRRTVAHKVDSIQYLLAQVGATPSDLMEIGSGTGAVIEECKKRGLGTRFCAVDYSKTALAYLGARDPSIRTIQADITQPEFRLEDPVDIVVCTHVLEHLERPQALLSAIAGRLSFRYAVIEVPLEDLPINRLKSPAEARTMNAAGHVQFFTARSFEALVRGCGLAILSRRRYVPTQDFGTIAYQAKRHSLSRARHAIKIVTNNLLPKVTAPLWSRAYYAHYAVICRASEPEGGRGSDAPRSRDARAR